MLTFGGSVLGLSILSNSLWKWRANFGASPLQRLNISLETDRGQVP